MHMKLGYRHSQLVDATGTGEYEVIPTLGTLPPARAAAN
jgi:hypothetical protein